ETPFSPVSLALGAEATFVARTHDIDRAHMTEVFRRAHHHRGAALVEVFQNRNVVNDGALEGVTGKANPAETVIPLHDGQPVRFGEDGRRGVARHPDGSLEVVDVEAVGEERIVVHDEGDLSTAFALARLATGPDRPTPM